MATTVKIKRTSVPGRAANTTTLPSPGELGLNMADGILYGSNGSYVFEIGANNTTVNITNSVSVGANVVVNTSTVSVGNSVVNTKINATSLTVGANVVVNTSTVSVGNSSVNTIITSSQLSTDIAQLDVALYVGDNVDITTTGVVIGNSTVNCTANSTAYKADVGFMTNQILNYQFTVPSTQNMMLVGPYSIGASGNLVISTGARVIII